MFSYYFLRLSGPVLIILFGIKILSGYALTGRIDSKWLAKFHDERIFDILLLPLFLFHGFYGMRLFILDLGFNKEKLLFWLSTILSLIIYGLIYFFVL